MSDDDRMKLNAEGAFEPTDTELRAFANVLIADAIFNEQVIEWEGVPLLAERAWGKLEDVLSHIATQLVEAAEALDPEVHHKLGELS